MKKGKCLTVMVFSDHMAEHKQYRISIAGLRAAVVCLALGCLTTVAFALLWARSSHSTGVLQKLTEENQALLSANQRYLNATVEIEKKLKYFDEKTNKLAGMIGLETGDHSVAGLGGASLFENELNQYLRYDLSLIEQTSSLLEDRLQVLVNSYGEQSEFLETTPSLLPARGWLSSGFSYRVDPFTRARAFHSGLDVSAPLGTPIYAPASGVIVEQETQAGFGNTILIRHGNGIETRYAHLSRFHAIKGKRVKRGDLLGYVGNTGRSTGPHLHYEVHKDGKPVDPMKFIIEDAKSY